MLRENAEWKVNAHNNLIERTYKLEERVGLWEEKIKGSTEESMIQKEREKMDFGIAGVSGITVICYLAAQVIKATPLDNKWLPVICGVLGGILGVVGMYVVPGWPGGDVLSSISIGIVSGFAATGANQVYKQLADCHKAEK